MDFSILSRYDDFLANCFLDNLFLWFPTIRMNSDLVCGQVDTKDVIPIIRQRIVHETNPARATKELIQLPLFQEFLKNKGDRQILEFSQHMRRYMCMFMPNAGFEVYATKRYTGKMEACIIATQDWKVGEKVALCQGSIAKLTAEEDEILKSEGRDFSVMVSTRKKCACLFLGPARFMNHDCDANCEFILVGSNAVTFKVKKNIKEGEEMTVFYGKHYFGEDNCECLCASCERQHEGSFSKSEKTVIELPEEEIILASTRSGSRKRKENVDGHDYGVERLSKKSMLNHTNLNQQKSLLPVDENQYAPNSEMAINEKELRESQSQCIPENLADDNRHIVIDDYDVLESNYDPQKENGAISTVVLDTINEEKDKLEVMDNSTPSGNTSNLTIESNHPVEIDILNIEDSDLAVGKELVRVPSSNDDNENENSVEDAKVPLTHYSEKSNEQLLECNIPEEEIISQGSNPILYSTSECEKSVKSVSPIADIANKSSDFSKEIDVDSLPVIDEGPSLEPINIYNSSGNVSDIENTLAPTSDEDDGDDIENTKLTDNYADNSSDEYIEIMDEESTIDMMDNLNSQIPMDMNTIVSNGCKETGIEFSEGFSDKSKTSPKTKKTTRLFGPEDAIRQVRSVVINHGSDKRLNSKKNDLSSCRTVCNIWIPVNNSTKKQVNTTLQELKDDMQKIIDMEAETEGHSVQDTNDSSSSIHETDTENNRDPGYVYDRSSLDEDEDKRIHKVADKDKPFHAWSTSSSSSVCHNSDYASLRSETPSTYSINESENFSVPDEYTPNTEPRNIGKNNDQMGNTFTCQDDYLQTINDRTSINSATESSDSSNNSPSVKLRFVELIDPPTAIVREEEPKTINFTYLGNMCDSKSQHEKDRAIVLDDLPRSYTSSSNDSVCFSSNDFDPTDISSPMSVSSNDSILVKQGDMESCRQQESDFNPITKLNSYSTRTSNSKFKETSTEITSPNQPNILKIPKEYEYINISHSNLPRISKYVDLTHTASVSSSSSMNTLDQNMDLNSTDVPDPINSTYSVDISDTNNTPDNVDSTSDITAKNPCQTNTKSFVNASIPVNIISISNSTNQINTENTTGVSNILDSTANLTANPISFKRCCPDFDKNTSTMDDKPTICPRCLRHFNIFGVEWPKRIGKKRPKSKSKGTKMKNTHTESSKSNLRTKPNVLKQRPKQKSSSKPDSDGSMDLYSSENTDTAASNEQNSTDESEFNHVSNQSKETEAIPLETTADKEQSQSTSVDQPGCTNAPVSKAPRKYKPKLKRDYYYYKLVLVNEEPKPERLMVKPDRPYALRLNKSVTTSPDNPKKAKSKSTSGQLPKETDKDSAQSSNKNNSKKVSNGTVKKKKRTSPLISIKNRSRAASQTPRPKRSGRGPYKSRKKGSYYEWVLVVEDDSPEEIPINTDPNKRYHFRARDTAKSYSETLPSGKKPQDNSSKESKKEEPSQDSILEATLTNSSQLKEKMDEVIPQNSTQENPEKPSSSQSLDKNIQKSLKQNPKVPSDHLESSRARIIEKQILDISSSARQVKITTRFSSSIPEKEKSDKPVRVPSKRSNRRQPDRESPMNTRSSSKENQVKVYVQSSQAKDNSAAKSLATVKSRNYNTRHSEKSTTPPVQISTEEILKKVNIQQREILEVTSNLALETKKTVKSKKRPLDSVEKPTYDILVEPPSKKRHTKQPKQSNVASAKAELKIPRKPITRSSSRAKESSTQVSELFSKKLTIRTKEPPTQVSGEHVSKKLTTTPNKQHGHTESVVRYATRSKAQKKETTK